MHRATSGEVDRLARSLTWRPISGGEQQRLALALALVAARGTPALVAALTTWLAEQDLPLADLRAGRQRLEDVFCGWSPSQGRRRLSHRRPARGAAGAVEAGGRAHRGVHDHGGVPALAEVLEHADQPAATSP